MGELPSNLENLISRPTPTGEKGGSKWKKIFIWGTAGALVAGIALGGPWTLIGAGAGALYGSRRA